MEEILNRSQSYGVHRSVRLRDISSRNCSFPRIVAACLQCSYADHEAEF